MSVFSETLKLLRLKNDVFFRNFNAFAIFWCPKFFHTLRTRQSVSGRPVFCFFQKKNPAQILQFCTVQVGYSQPGPGGGSAGAGGLERSPMVLDLRGYRPLGRS